MINKRKNPNQTISLNELYEKMIISERQTQFTKITEADYNIYLLIVAAEKKRTDILFEYSDEEEKINKLFDQINELHVVEMYFKGQPVTAGNSIDLIIKSVEKIICKYTFEYDGMEYNIFNVTQHINKWIYQKVIMKYLRKLIYNYNRDSKLQKQSEVKELISEILEFLALVYKNYGAKVSVIEQTEYEIVAEINGTICKMEKRFSKRRFICPVDNVDVMHKGFKKDEALTINQMLQFYAIYISNAQYKRFAEENTFKTEADKFIINKCDTLFVLKICYCAVKKHNIKDIIIQIQVITESGEVIWDYIHGSFCNTCKKVYALEKDYQSLRGVPICEVVILPQTDSCIKKPSESVLSTESVIHSHGYNVNIHSNISSSHRKYILESLIEEKIVSQEAVLSYLDNLISKWKNNMRYATAVSKWESDRKYIENFWYTDERVRPRKVIIKKQ